MPAITDSNSPAEAERRRERATAIRQFSDRFLTGENQDLFEDILVTLTRLARDEADRGDVKLVHKSLGELRYAMKVFAPYQATRKISIFGSSRTPEEHADYQQAVAFAREMSAAGWMVITGAGNGIMKAGHAGSGREAGFGVAIRLPFEQKTNTIIADDEKLVNFRYFFTRKLMFMKESSAIALFPGGFGTLDEGFEVLTLVQTGKAPLIPIIMVDQPGGDYWQTWHKYLIDELVRTNMISEQDTNLFRVTDDAAEAVRDVLDFYRVYHSMRYVDDELILRLEHALDPALLDRLNSEFAALLSGGTITQCGPLPEEQGEFPDKTRLRLHFDRKSFGLLRQCIDMINAAPAPPALGQNT